MRYKAALGIGCIGVVSSVGCVASLDSPPVLATPSLTSTHVTSARPATAATLDTILALDGEPPTETSGANQDERAQQLATIHVTAPAAPPNVAQSETLAPERNAVGSIPSYRFGESEPVLVCTVLRACIIELQTTEALVDDPIAGDQARWIITTARTGRGGASTLVIVKPKACDVTTNLVLSTDRRIYDVDLDSPPCSPRDTNPKRSYTRHIRFTYPNESDSSAVGHAEEMTRSEKVHSEVADSGSVANAAWPDSVLSNRKYRVVPESRGPFGVFGRKRSAFPWRPAAITDDGAHVYVSLPEMARKYPSPVLYALEDDGSRTMVNYVVRDTVIVADRVFRRGVLVIANGKQEETLVFENRAWSATSSSHERQ